jgi:hypothetical protein
LPDRFDRDCRKSVGDAPSQFVEIGRIFLVRGTYRNRQIRSSSSLRQAFQHSRLQFSRGHGYPGPLQLKNLLSLAGHLHPHSFDLSPDVIKLHDVLARLMPFQSAGARPRPIGRLVREAEADSII